MATKFEAIELRLTEIGSKVRYFESQNTVDKMSDKVKKLTEVCFSNLNAYAEFKQQMSDRMKEVEKIATENISLASSNTKPRNIP